MSKKFDLVKDLLSPLAEVGKKGKAKSSFSKSKACQTVIQNSLRQELIKEKKLGRGYRYVITQKGKSYILKNISSEEKETKIDEQEKQLKDSLFELSEKTKELFSSFYKDNEEGHFFKAMKSFHQNIDEGIKKIELVLKEVDQAKEIKLLGDSYLESICKHRNEVDSELIKIKTWVEDEIDDLSRKWGLLNKMKNGEASFEPKELEKKLKEEYEKILSNNSMYTMIPLPWLYEKIKKTFPTLSIEKYKQELDRLCSETVIDLHLVNSSDEIEDPKFVISSSCGEFYYLSWRS